MEEILEECLVPRYKGCLNRLRLVEDHSHMFTEYRIEVSYPSGEEKPVELTFWQKVRWLFSKKSYPTEIIWTVESSVIFSLEDTDPVDPYVENCVREVWDYLTKDYTTTI